MTEQKMKKAGILYGIGVGPGDPELMTLKGLRLLKETELVAVPGDSKEKSAAYRIACDLVPSLEEKTVFTLAMPMTRDRASMRARHEEIAKILGEHLDTGRDVAFLTLGDPGIYSTFGYIRKLLCDAGYEVVTVPGVTSFSAGAARLGISLAEWDERVEILPTAHVKMDSLGTPGTHIFMKPRGDIKELKKLLQKEGHEVFAIENCGAGDEKIYRGLMELPDEVGYMTTIIVRTL